MKQLKKPYLPPRAIFNQHSKFLESEFIAFSKKLNNRIKPILDLDYSQIKIELEKIQSEYKLWIDQKKLLKGIERNYKLINAWVESKLGRDDSPKNKTKQDAASPTPEYLQNELYAEHWEKVKNVIRDGVVSKKPANEIYNEILKTTDMNKARAKFWAEDQIAQFEAEKRRIVSIREGFTHYRWVILGKNTRDTHRANFGKIFSWNVGADNLTRPGARHPGEDYRCHCFTENLTEEEANDLGYTVEPPRQPASIEDLVGNYYGGKESNATLKGVLNAFANTLKTLGTFEEAMSIKEAEEYARKLGFKDVNYGGDENLYVANILNAYLTELGSKTVDGFPSVRIVNYGYVGSFDPVDKVIRFNGKSGFWKNPVDFLKANSKYVRTEDPMYLFFHEYSHYLMKKNGWYKLLQDYTFNKEVENIIYAHLGKNATINALELIADSYATKRTTGSLPDEIKLIIKDLKKLETFKGFGGI